MESDPEVRSGLDEYLVQEFLHRCGDRGACVIEHGGIRFSVVRNTGKERPKKQGREGNQSPDLT